MLLSYHWYVGDVPVASTFSAAVLVLIHCDWLDVERSVLMVGIGQVIATISPVSSCWAS